MAPTHPKRSLDQSIHALEALKLPDHDKVELVLILAGQKPATVISTARTIYFADRPAESRDHADFDALVAWTAASGLPYELTDQRVNHAAFILSGTNGQWLKDAEAAAGRPIDAASEIANSSDWDQLTLYIATSPTWLAKMKLAHQTNDLQRAGEAYGFPPAAIAAYAAHNYLSPAEAKVSATLRPFAQFGFSPNHTAADLETAKRWAATVRQLAPDLYERVILKP